MYVVRKEQIKSMYWQVMNLKEMDLDSFSVDFISQLENVQAIETAKKALATGKSLHITDGFDPMGDKQSESGKGKKREEVEEKVEENAEKQEMDSKPQSREAGDMHRATIDPSRTYLLQFDGGARGNPSGCAGAGMVLFDEDGTEVWCGWKFLHTMTNNQAEYNAAFLGLQCAKSLGIKHLRIEGDSELVLKQLSGKYQVRDRKLREIWKPTRELLQDFETFNLQHIPRAENKRADWLANHSMDTETTYGFNEV